MRTCTHAHHVDIHDTTEDRDILAALGQRARRNTGVCDHEVRHAVAIDEYFGCLCQCGSVGHVKRMDAGVTPGPATPGRAPAIPPPAARPGQPQPLAGIVPRQRGTDAAGGTGKKNPQRAAGLRGCATSVTTYFFLLRSVRTLPINWSASVSRSS